MSEKFRDKCKSFSELLDILNKLLMELKQQMILQDLAIVLNTHIKVGRHLISGVDWLEETDVGGESFNLINKSEKNITLMSFIQKKNITPLDWD